MPIATGCRNRSPVPGDWGSGFTTRTVRKLRHTCRMADICKNTLTVCQCPLCCADHAGVHLVGMSLQLIGWPSLGALGILVLRQCRAGRSRRTSDSASTGSSKNSCGTFWHTWRIWNRFHPQTKPCVVPRSESTSHRLTHVVRAAATRSRHSSSPCGTRLEVRQSAAIPLEACVSPPESIVASCCTADSVGP